MIQNKSLNVYCDGGARGNPGPAGIGIVIADESGRDKKFKKFIGVKTNNQAEYEAVLFALEKIKANYNDVQKINFYLDSELAVKQLRGEYKIKNEELGRLLIRIRNFIIKHNFSADFSHVRREKNHQADKLVNEAIDERGL